METSKHPSPTGDRRSGENVAYFNSVRGEHGIAYSREAFRQMSRLGAADRTRLRDALAAMRTDDRQDEELTETWRVRRFPDGFRFVFERSGSALTVLTIAGQTATPADRRNA